MGGWVEEDERRKTKRPFDGPPDVNDAGCGSVFLEGGWVGG